MHGVGWRLQFHCVAIYAFAVSNTVSLRAGSSAFTASLDFLELLLRVHCCVLVQPVLRTGVPQVPIRGRHELSNCPRHPPGCRGRWLCFFFVQPQSTELPATTEGRCLRHLSQGRTVGCYFNMYRVCVSSRNWSLQECDTLKGDHPKNWQELDRAPVCFNLNFGGGASEVSLTTSMVACRRYLVSTFSYASLPSVSVFYRHGCTYCSRVFVVSLSLTSTHRRALHQEYLSSSSVQTTRTSHYVHETEVSNPAARDRTVPRREQ